jgi:predicted ATPase
MRLLTYVPTANRRVVRPADESERTVLQVLDDQVSLDLAQVASEVLIDPRQVSDVLHRLLDEGIVIAHEVEGHTRYTLRPGVEVE